MMPDLVACHFVYKLKYNSGLQFDSNPLNKCQARQIKCQTQEKCNDSPENIVNKDTLTSATTSSDSAEQTKIPKSQIGTTRRRYCDSIQLVMLRRGWDIWRHSGTGFKAIIEGVTLINKLTDTFDKRRKRIHMWCQKPQKWKLRRIFNKTTKSSELYNTDKIEFTVQGGDDK